MLDILEKYKNEGYSSTIISLKLLLIIIGSILIVLNFKALISFNDINGLLVNLQKVNFVNYFLLFCVMATLCETLGSLVFMFEENHFYRNSMKDILFVYLILDFGLLCMAVETTFIHFDAYSSIDSFFDNDFYKVLGMYKNNSEIAEFLDNIQKDYYCCGADDYTDWFKADWNLNATIKNVSFPESCCNIELVETKDKKCIHNVDYLKVAYLTPYPKGCIDVLRWWYGSYFHINGMVFLILTVFHGASFGMAVYMKYIPRFEMTSLEKKKLLFKQNLFKKSAKQQNYEY